MTDPALADLQQLWEAQASADPLWAILSNDSRRRRGWDLPSFLATGERFVEEVLSTFEDLGHAPGGTALDFGCGVGRLTQPLAARFDAVTGVDISPTMIEAARRLNRFGDRVTYVVNARPDLAFVPTSSVDMVMSFITLQHVPPEASRAYLGEFLRILRPGGLLFFQVPSRRNTAVAEVGTSAEPVAPENCRADLRLAGVPPAMATRETAEITVTVRNESSEPWVSTAANPLRVANHWQRADGSAVVHDDGRSNLPNRIPAGGSVSVELEVTAPDEPGPLHLVVDVVQEGVRWFADAGSSVVVAPIHVAPPVAASAGTPGTGGQPVPDPLAGIIAPEWFDAPAFAMHPIPRDEVEHMLAEHGATVLRADEYIDDWVGYSYFVAMSAG